MKTKGYSYRIEISEDEGHDFVTGQSGFLRWKEEGTDWSIRSAEFKLADGSRAYGAVLLCDGDSGEHYGSFIISPAGDIAEQGTSEFFDLLGRTEDEVVPYKYRYFDPLERDHHVDEDTGWSE